MALQAYFDESGTHGRARVTGVAGFIGPAEEWAKLEEEWEAELARFAKDSGHKIQNFHAYECENGQEFWSGIDISIREAYYQQLARVVVKYNKLMGISFAIENDQWGCICVPRIQGSLPFSVSIMRRELLSTGSFLFYKSSCWKPGGSCVC
jgi:hypothetical protein